MKRVYFIRHGESEGNAGPIRQTEETALTEKGRSQAAFLAERCARLPIETIICSTMNRAKETAQIILGKISKPIEYLDLFVERRLPSELLGKPKDDPIALKFKQASGGGLYLISDRFSDEENFEDLKHRVSEALEYLSHRPEENILVVTHGFFMTIVVAYVLSGNKLTREEGKRAPQVFWTENTGITILEYDERKKILPWHLLVWNDHAHLG